MSQGPNSTTPQTSTREAKLPWYRQWWFLLVVVLAALLIMVVFPIWWAEDSQEVESAPEIEEDEASYQVGNYRFYDVEVGADAFGDFEVRARATNAGVSRDRVSITATLWSHSQEVGTARKVVSTWNTGDTIALEMTSADSYTTWDDIEFHVALEW